MPWLAAAPADLWRVPRHLECFNDNRHQDTEQQEAAEQHEWQEEGGGQRGAALPRRRVAVGRLAGGVEQEGIPGVACAQERQHVLCGQVHVHVHVHRLL